MPDRKLERLERVAAIRRHAQEIRLSRTRRLLEKAAALRERAERERRSAAAVQDDLLRQCYAAPQSAQAWIAQRHQAQDVLRTARAAEERRREEEELLRRKLAEAKDMLRGDARLNAVRGQLAAARRSAARTREESAAEERQDCQRNSVQP